MKRNKLRNGGEYVEQNKMQTETNRPDVTNKVPSKNPFESQWAIG